MLVRGIGVSPFRATRSRRDVSARSGEVKSVSGGIFDTGRTRLTPWRRCSTIPGHLGHTRLEAALIVSYSLAVDIGGTFTDIVLRHASGQLTVDKTLTTPHDLIEGFFTGVHAVLKSAGLTPRDVDGIVVHATTIVTNALIERKGLATALLVTDGFRDVLRIRNEHRYEMYDPQIEFPEPLVPP